jgi:hypothetical protein
MWMNQIPAQFNGRLLHSDEGASSSFDNLDFELVQYRASVLSIEVLENTLRNSPQSSLFQRKRASNSLVTYTKSPCSYNDTFIFFTNCLPIDHLEQIPFNLTTDITRGTRTNLPNKHKSKYKQDLEFFEQFSTANAVDDNNQTCWKINRTIRSGDLYGIDFQITRDQSFSIEYLHEKSLQNKLQISISLDSYVWAELPRRQRRGVIYDKQRNLVTFHTQLFPDGYKIFRFIRFMSLMDEDNAFGICEVRLINSKDFY